LETAQDKKLHVTKSLATGKEAVGQKTQ